LPLYGYIRSSNWIGFLYYGVPLDKVRYFSGIALKVAAMRARPEVHHHPVIENLISEHTTFYIQKNLAFFSVNR